jgi:hypothetical protein
MKGWKFDARSYIPILPQIGQLQSENVRSCQHTDEQLDAFGMRGSEYNGSKKRQSITVGMSVDL